MDAGMPSSPPRLEALAPPYEIVVGWGLGDVEQAARV